MVPLRDYTCILSIGILGFIERSVWVISCVPLCVAALLLCVCVCGSCVSFRSLFERLVNFCGNRHIFDSLVSFVVCCCLFLIMAFCVYVSVFNSFYLLVFLSPFSRHSMDYSRHFFDILLPYIDIITAVRLFRLKC